MNSAKKVMNKQNREESHSTVSAAKGSQQISTGVGDTKRIVIGAICIIIVLVLCIGVAIQQFKPKVVLTVNDTKYTLEDMMYPIYERESQYLPYNEMYQMYTGRTVWENTYMGSDRNVDSSAPNSVGLKQEIIDVETEYKVLYEEAKKVGYSLDDAEKKEVQEEVTSALKGLSFLQRMQLNISKRKLTTRFEQRKLSDKYKEDQVNTLNGNVDEKAATKDISKEDYRQYKLQYYAFATSSTNAEGKAEKISDDDMKKLEKQLKELHSKAADAKDFTKLLEDEKSDDTKASESTEASGEEEESEEDTPEITHNEASFTEKDGWAMVTTKKLLSQIKSMKKNEISDIIKDEKSGYVLFVKMIDNNSTESYDQACDSAIEEAQNSAYDTWYQEVLKNYTTKTNEDVWDDVEIGTMTTDIVTAEDLEKMNEDSSDATSE